MTDVMLPSSESVDVRSESGAVERQERSTQQPKGWAPTLGAEGRVQRFETYEAEIFRFALTNAGGCVSRAAEMLGVGRATMYRKMRAYEIVAPPVSERAIERSRKSPSGE